VAIELQMPKSGLTMTEGKVVEWLKRIGERVEKGEAVLVVETEKATFDVESPAAGFLARIVVNADETVPVGTVVGLLVERAGEQVERSDGDAPRPPAPAAPPGSPGPAPAPEGRLVRPSNLQRVMAERMAASRREAAQTEMTVTIDASGLVLAKEALAAKVEREAGTRLTITDLVLRATALALGVHPGLNARFTPEGILHLDAIHLGMAMSVEDGLLVPVIRGAGRRTLAEVTRERARLVERGRAGALGPDELTGSTFTVSSLGMFGVEEFTAILNPPEAGILAVGAILDRPAVVEGRVVARPLMKVTLSYDHRVVDGAAAARFLGTLRELAESPSSMA
jgi:pyruvate dehydrogenase E2 component (dihydrolipoamide acetyltransferase)